MQELARGAEFERVDPIQHAARRLYRFDVPPAVGHPGAHRTGMQDHNGNAFGPQVMRKRDTSRVERSLAHAVTIEAAGTVVTDRPHAAGHQRYLGLRPNPVQQGACQKQRRQRIHLELRQCIFRRGGFQRFKAANAGVVNEICPPPE